MIQIPKVVELISKVPKKYNYSTFYIVMMITLMVLLQLVTLYHDWKIGGE